MQKLPKDCNILLSVINMKLRDEYTSLFELCEDMEINREQLEKKLHAAGFQYDEKSNRFI